jgi:hypothetical protein
MGVCRQYPGEACPFPFLCLEDGCCRGRELRLLRSAVPPPSFIEPPPLPDTLMRQHRDEGFVHAPLGLAPAVPARRVVPFPSPPKAPLTGLRAILDQTEHLGGVPLPDIYAVVNQEELKTVAGSAQAAVMEALQEGHISPDDIRQGLVEVWKKEGTARLSVDVDA